MAGISGNNLKLTKADEWLDFVTKHNDVKHYVSLAMRPGNFALMGIVEYSLFPPQTKANENFHVHVMEWRGELWNIFSTPRERHDDITRTAKSLALSITQNPPVMMSLGPLINMVAVASPTMNEAEVKSLLVKGGVPPELVKMFSGMEIFPGEVKATHAVENNQRLLRAPLKQEEHAAIQQRELAICDAMAHGVRPSIKEVADYVYGSGRVLASPRPAG